MLVRTWQVRDANAPMLPAVHPPQVSADSALRRFHIGVVAGVEHQQLDVAEDHFDRVVVGASCRECYPVQFHLPHLAPRLLRLARVRRVSVEHDPDRLIRSN
jgi:hypothetical protein